MSTARIDLGQLPTAAASVLLEYRRKGARAWIRLGETTKPVSEWDVSGGTVEIRARVRDKAGRLHNPGTITAWDTEEALTDETLPKDVSTWPSPTIVQDGPALLLSADVAPGLDPTDYQMEFRQGEDSGVPKDGLQLGFVDPNEELKAFVWHTSTGTQTIHVRAHRLSDGRLSDWTTVDFTAPTPVIEPTVGHSNDFASGTLETTDGGVAPLEINSGDLRHKAIYAGDLDAAANYAGDFTDIYAGDAGLYWPGQYTTASVTISPAEDIVLQWYPDLTSITRAANLYAGDCHWPAAMPHFQFEDGSYHDPRAFECSLQNGADETPTVITAQANVSAAGNADVTPGQVYSAASSYAMTFTITPYLGKRLTINNLWCRHWIWCRARPWHSHSDAMELLWEDTIAGSAVATIDITVTGESYDELYVQVLWKNAHANAATLWIRPNNDTASNYDRDGGAATKVVVGTGTIAQNEWEDARIRFHNPKTGAQRAISVEHNARWTSTTSDSPDAVTTDVWTDNSNAITSIRVTNSDSGNSHFAVGTITRCWGKRHHVE